MYHEKFVAVIKHKGKILREDTGGLVRLPFGSEYTILLKNKNPVKAVANTEVDGKDVLQSHGIIVPSNQSVEITGWMRDMDKTNKFKFIRKTKEIQKFRGDRIDDGLIRVEYRFEKKQLAKITRDPWSVRYKGNNWNWDYYGTADTLMVPLTGISSDGNYTVTSYNCDAPLKDEGITVKGKVINQEYNYGTTGLLENTPHVIVINLCGTSKTGERVKKVITTKSRTQCDVCGKKWKSHIKYCSNCGNYLH